jgi:hypothetical protein
MTIDERLYKLTERHEALSQSIELLTLGVRELTGEAREHGRHILGNSKQIARLGGIFEKLLGIVESHHNRLDNLEGA